MELKDLLLNLAVESGEIALPAEVEPIDEGQYADAMIAKETDELTRAIALTESLEAIAKRYEDMPLTAESLESYRFTIGHILHVSGVDVPVDMVASSFEAAEEKKSIGEKVKEVIKRILEWLAQKWDALLKFLRIRKGKVEKDTAEAKARTEDVKKAASHIKALGYTPGEAWAQGAGKRVEDEKQSPKHGTHDSNDRKGMPKYPVDKEGKALNMPTYSLPAWLVKDGKVDFDKIRQVIGLGGKGTLFNVMDLRTPSGAVANWSNAKDYSDFYKDFVEKDYTTKVWREHFDVIQQPAGNASVYDIDVDAVSKIAAELSRSAESMAAFIRDSQEGLVGDHKRLEAKVSKAANEEEAKHWQTAIAHSMKAQVGINSLMNNYHNVLITVHRHMSNLVLRIEKAAIASAK